MAPEMETLKARLKATWMAGDYGTFAKYLEPSAMEFLARLDVQPGTRMLDVACGAGQISVPAARAGARVTGVDIATSSIEQARARAQDEGLDARFEEGDAEMLPYENASFDVVASLFGAMFAPRPDRVAAELVRVCRPGGRIVMGNWTPGGFVGQMFKVIGRHVPPPALMPSPLLWGDEATVRERLHEGVAELRLTKRRYPFRYPFPPPRWWSTSAPTTAPPTGPSTRSTTRGRPPCGATSSSCGPSTTPTPTAPRAWSPSTSRWSRFEDSRRSRRVAFPLRELFMCAPSGRHVREVGVL
jgi:SAM-dependent methyltransferase